jgi:hypothetical protein
MTVSLLSFQKRVGELTYRPVPLQQVLSLCARSLVDDAVESGASGNASHWLSGV